MGALLMVFDRLGIDRDAVLSVTPEENGNESMAYYCDLLPVINMTRVVNHLVSVMPQVDRVFITHFLQPTATASHSILLVLFNLMLFHEARLADIAPHEEQLFAVTDQIVALTDKKNHMLEMTNEQAMEKQKRAERLEKLDADIKQLEEELKLETDAHNKEKQELDVVLKENHQLEVVLEQKKTHLDTILGEVSRKKALRVYDAEDVKAQAEKAARNVQEADEKCNSLRATLMQKETCLKNLQTIKPNLDTANNLIQEIMKLSESLNKDSECGDLDTDSKDGELDVLNTEMSELQVQLRELQAARAELADKVQENSAKRLRERTALQSALREAEEKDKKRRQRCKKAEERTEEIKEQTNRYDAEKAAGQEELDNIYEKFIKDIKDVEDTMFKLKEEIDKKILAKLQDLEG